SHGPLSTQLQEALDTSGRVVRTLAFVTVWQKKDQRRGLAPLCFTGGYVLIDDGLSTVSEVTELCFPNYDCVLVTQGVAVFEAHASKLGQRGVIRQEITAVAALGRESVEWFDFVT